MFTAITDIHAGSLIGTNTEKRVSECNLCKMCV